MLEDLQAVLTDVQTRIDAIGLDVTFAPHEDVWEEVRSQYAARTSDAVSVVGNSLAIKTPNGNFLTISGQELPRIWAVLPYARALGVYEAKVDELARALGFASRSSGRAKDDIFKKLPSDDWEAELKEEDAEAIRRHISQDLNLLPEDQERFLRFLQDAKWSGVAKTLERSDWRMAAIVGAGKWLANAATRRGELADALADSEIFEREMAREIADASAMPPVSAGAAVAMAASGGRNLILYGAPGTGKSHRIDAMVKGSVVTRTVFHADTQNSDFFGCLKPSMEDGKVVYGFVPGPLSKALAQARSDQSNHHYLVVEELNRAPAAAVFGELFQLLDRHDDGSSVYSVDFPTRESEEWFRKSGFGSDKLLLPRNLSIYATMNSADQGVFPLDTAFRRRWEQEYLPLAEGDGPSGVVSIMVNGRMRQALWKDFLSALNNYLLRTVRPPEDKLLGLWFVKERELSRGDIPAKVLLYLVDDLLRHEDKSIIFAQGMTTYGELSRAMTSQPAGQIFCDAFIGSLKFAPEDTGAGGQSTPFENSTLEVGSDESLP